MNANCKYQFWCRMKLTSFTDYGFRALMLLASQPDRDFSTGELAACLDVSRNHLAKVMSALSSAGYVATRRGGGGGARLAMDPAAIRLGEVVRRLEGGQALVECFSTDNNCVLSPDCRLKSRLDRARHAFLKKLDEDTLADCLPVSVPGVTAGVSGSSG